MAGNVNDPMRDQEEVQKAHDLLACLILEGHGNAILAYSADVLCWVLTHSHNHKFDTLLLQAEKLAEDLGMRLERIPDTQG